MEAHRNGRLQQIRRESQAAQIAPQPECGAAEPASKRRKELKMAGTEQGGRQTPADPSSKEAKRREEEYLEELAARQEKEWSDLTEQEKEQEHEEHRRFQKKLDSKYGGTLHHQANKNNHQTSGRPGTTRQAKAC